MTKMILGYWDIHALALPIRTLLELVGADYEDKLYSSDKRDEWFKEKNNLGLLFPNLPYLIDGEIKITEHLAIIRYIARKYNFGPKNEKETILIEQVESFVSDLRFKLYRAAYDTLSYEKSKKEYTDMVGDKLEGLEKLFGQHTYVTGDRLTYIDVYVHDYLVFLNAFDNQVLKNKPNLMKYLYHMNELPAFKAYKNSNKWVKRPFCANFASFKGVY